ncbi:lactococcin 972 family bacteriocin [Rothia uropygioeca]|uniref:lactococcin 972 family bacteriocin n=1 Tax=Kocuria sp. 257 TaxID=2021970 RepID=UPI001012966E
MKRKIISVATETVLAFGAVAAAQATDHVRGGYWGHGVSGGGVFSDYLYHGRCHGSTAKGTFVAKSGNTPAGHWAKVSAPSRWYAIDKAYWNYC